MEAIKSKLPEKNESRADYIFTAKYLLPTNSNDSAISDGGIAVYGDTIVDIAPASILRKNYPEAPFFHEPHGLIMPGLINTHTHAPMSCFRGLADDLPLMEWLEEHIFPVEANLTPDIVHTAAQLSIAEMIRSGTTSFCDMYLFSREVARAADQAGIRSWIGEVLYDFSSPCYGEVDNGFTYTRNLHAEYTDHPLITISVDPHSVYTCSPDLLVKLKALSEELDALYVIHLSENEAEVTTCLKRYSKRPVEHLQSLGLLDSKTLACHCVKVSDNDLQQLAEKKVKIAHCMESNLKLASGIAPVISMLKYGIDVSLGTDGSASNNDVDLFCEMDTVAKIHKITGMDPTVMNAEQTLYAATLGGARALNAQDKIGSLERGKQADFIVLDLNRPHLTPIYNLPSHLVYAVKGSDVQHSFIAGKQVMKNRELLTLDEHKILAEMNRISQKIRQSGR